MAMSTLHIALAKAQTQESAAPQGTKVGGFSGRSVSPVSTEQNSETSSNEGSPSPSPSPELGKTRTTAYRSFSDASGSSDVRETKASPKFEYESLSSKKDSAIFAFFRRIWDRTTSSKDSSSPLSSAQHDMATSIDQFFKARHQAIALANELDE